MNFDDIHAILDRATRLAEKNTQDIAEMRVTLERLGEKTDQQIEKLGQQIGALGNKFGSFTEGLAMDSVAKMLDTRFGVTLSARRYKRRNKQTGEEMELDYFGYENSAVNRAVMVEVKSQFRRRDIEQVRKRVSRFREFFPEYAESELYVVIAYVEFENRDVLHEALAEGFFLATLSDDIFRLKTPKGFQGRDFNAAPLLG